MISIKYYISFRCIAQWLNIFIHYEMITTESLVTICHNSALLRLLLTIFPKFALHPWLIYFIHRSLYFIIPFTYFILLPHHHSTPCGDRQFVLCIYESLSALFVPLSCLVSTYRWDHTGLFLFVWFISISIMSSPFIHIITNGPISLFIAK